MQNEHVEKLLQELYGKDLVGKDIWNPLHNPDATKPKPSIELDEPYQPKRIQWFDPKALQLNMPPAYKLGAVSEIIKETGNKDQTKVASLLQKISHAIDADNINDETMNIIGEQIYTLKSIYDSFKQVSKQPEDRLTLNSILKDIINVVYRKISKN